MKPSTPHVIGICGLKGGIGKTTFAIITACILAKQNPHHRILYVDSDHSSQTGHQWFQHAKTTGSPLPFDRQVWTSAAVGSLIEDEIAKNSYDIYVIDVGGAGHEVLPAITQVVTELIIVTTPSLLDIVRIQPTIESAAKGATKHQRIDNINIHILITKVDGRRKSRNEDIKREIAETYGDDILIPAHISSRPTSYTEIFGSNPLDDPNFDCTEFNAVLTHLNLTGTTQDRTS